MSIQTNGMLNWSHDVPPDTRRIFVIVLNFLKRRNKRFKILEIGTFVGTSIIEMLKIAEDANATVIDNWSLSKTECKYTEDIKTTFLNNITISSVQNRIEVLEGDSTFHLNNLIREKRLYDFIYVDGSHISFDVYSDLIQSWELLRIGGILAIDDYLWYDMNKIQSCKIAVDHFLAKYVGKYGIIHYNYRIFLYKK